MASRDEARVAVQRAMAADGSGIAIVGEGQTEREWVFRAGHPGEGTLVGNFPIYAVSKGTGRVRELRMPSREAFDLNREEDAYEASHR